KAVPVLRCRERGYGWGVPGAGPGRLRPIVAAQRIGLIAGPWQVRIAAGGWQAARPRRELAGWAVAIPCGRRAAVAAGRTAVAAGRAVVAAGRAVAETGQCVARVPACGLVTEG